jgi:prepilin-type N-terminal cleavage/methylation domain-containing protein
MGLRRAFTLIEVLISIALLGIIIAALFPTVSMMRSSNEQLLEYLKKAKKVTQSTKVLYMDILGSDGNLTIKKDDFSRLCIQKTRNSLYGLSVAKVCWVVGKEKNTLTRVEGNNYHLPTRSEDKVEVDRVIEHIDLFDVYHHKDKVLVFLREKGKKPISFMVQGITKPKPPPKDHNATRRNNRNTARRNHNATRRDHNATRGNRNVNTPRAPRQSPAGLPNGAPPVSPGPQNPDGAIEAPEL